MSIPKRRRKGEISSLQKSSSLLASPSASFVGGNIDLLSKIVLCLPIKSIIAFKLVSKQWNSVISDSSFQKSIEKKCQSGFLIRNFICSTNTNVTQEFHYNFIDKDDITSSIPFTTFLFGRRTKNKQRITIDQSCNGLLLCSCESPIRRKRVYYVYNRVTSQYKLITPKNGFCIASVGLAFDSSKSPFYKVIILRKGQGGCRIHIYSSETSSLKNCGENFQVKARVSGRPGVYWNGCLNWMSTEGILVYFEVDQEVIKRLTMTQYIINGERTKIHYFDVCKGHLQVIVQESTRFDILEMDTSYTGWNLKYRMDLESGLKVSYPVLVGESLDCKVMFYDEVDSAGEGSPKLLLLIHSPMRTHGVISYDIKDNQFERIHNLEQGCFYPMAWMCGMMSIRLYQYTGSLARV